MFRRILLIVAALLLVVLATMGLLAYQAYSWWQTGPQAHPATYPPLQLSATEMAEVEEVVRGLNQANQNKSVYDVKVGANVFNGVFEKILEHRRHEANEKAEDQRLMRVAFAPEGVVVAFTEPIKDPKTGERKYLNGEMTLDIEIVEGAVKEAKAGNIKLAGSDAPFLVRKVVENALAEAKNGTFKRPDGAASRMPKEIKLLKREGDKIHLVWDGKEYKK